MELERSCSDVFCTACNRLSSIRNTDELFKLGNSLRPTPKSIVHCLQIVISIAGEDVVACAAATVIPSDPAQLIISRPEWSINCRSCGEPIRITFPIYRRVKNCATHRDFGCIRVIEDCTELLTVTGKFLKHHGRDEVPVSGATTVIVRT